MRILLFSFVAAVISVASSILAEMQTGDTPVLGQFVRLTLSHNPDIAFGIVLPYPLKEILIATALIIVLVVALRSRHDTLSSLAFGLIIGGAIGNLIDRIPDGVVTDFIAIGTFPIFNVADSCITVGAGILLLESLKSRH